MPLFFYRCYADYIHNYINWCSYSTLLEKRVLKGFFVVPYNGTLAVEPSKRFQKIQEPFGEPLKVL